MTNPTTEPSARLIGLLALPIIVYLSTRWIHIFITDAHTYLIYDYTGRLLILIYVICIPEVRAFALSCYQRPWRGRQGRLPWGVLFAITVIIQCFGWELAGYLSQPLNSSQVHTKLFIPIHIEEVWLQLVDLSLGLALVAFSEELLFRGIMKRLLESVIENKIAIIFVASLIFGLMHWPGGVGKIVNTGITGVFFMVSYFYAKSLWPCTVAHYLINFIYFSEI
ncbi:MAG: type II CAAX endopeptidase family protein [Rhodospirillales bacterium]